MPKRRSNHLSEPGEGVEEVARVLGLDFVEVLDGLAAGFDDGGEDAGLLGLADVVVGVADVDRPLGEGAELLDQGPMPKARESPDSVEYIMEERTASQSLKDSVDRMLSMASSRRPLRTARRTPRRFRSCRASSVPANGVIPSRTSYGNNCQNRL